MHVINAGAIIPPPIERYLIKVMRLAKQELDPVADADLLEDIASSTSRRASTTSSTTA